MHAMNPDAQNLVLCSIRSRQQEGSCNACQRRDQEVVILVELKTLTFRVCNQCAKKLAEKITALLSPTSTQHKEQDDARMVWSM